MWYLVVIVATLFVSSMLAPKPKPPAASGLEDIQAPTAEDGREIPVLFGTRDIAGPNVTWYGDFRAVAVKKKP